MQSKKTITLLSIIMLLQLSCSSKNESFDLAIERSKKGTVHFVPKIAEGLPYFQPNTLTPIWDTQSQAIVTIPDFELIDQDGKKVTQNIFRNKKSIVGFIFTSCGGFCPLLIQKLKTLEKKISPISNIQIVVFSVDPKIDTPSVLKTYAKAHRLDRKNWKLITGDKETIYNLVKNTFASEVRRVQNKNLRIFAHTEHFYMIDKNAHLRAILNGTRLDLEEHTLKIAKKL